MFGRKKTTEKKSAAKKPATKKAGGESLPHAPARKRSYATPSPKGLSPLKSPFPCFIDTAFTSSAQDLIASTSVDNSAQRTTDAGNGQSLDVSSQDHFNG